MMNILIVDDEELSLEMMETIVRELKPKSNVHVFSDPRDAYAWAENEIIDVAFLDIEMGVMSGVELGKKLKAKNPKINIIFVTAYLDYMQDAFGMHCSGYVPKPATKERIKAELENLRFPMPKKDEGKPLYVKTFGDFEVFINGVPLKFERKKTKEMFAYLIDRKGAVVNTAKLCAVMYEDDSDEKSNKAKIRKCVLDLKTALKEVNQEDVFIKGFDKYSINPDLIQCDYYDYENGEPYAIREFRGEYMSDYSWAEETCALLFNGSS